MDEATASLVLQLYLNDIMDIEGRRKGKQIDGQPSDAELTFNLLKTELQQAQQVLSDRRLASSLALAIQQDAGTLTQIQEEENLAIQDHELARRLGGVPSTGLQISEVMKDSNNDEDLTNTLAELNVTNRYVYFHDANRRGSSSSSSSSASSYHTAKSSDSIRKECCVICGDKKHMFDVLQAPCTHYYCGSCFKLLVEASTKDESLYPPRCCQREIPLASGIDFLDHNLLELFQRKGVEFSTPNRTYCADPACSAFIPPKNIQLALGTCISCDKQTCSMCKGLPHTNTECPEDPNEKLMNDLAETEKWTKCNMCTRWIELTTGCFHMQ